MVVQQYNAIREGGNLVLTQIGFDLLSQPQTKYKALNVFVYMAVMFLMEGQCKCQMEFSIFPAGCPDL